MMAYMLNEQSGGQDDGEYGASLRLQALLSDAHQEATVLFVIRRFGGALLGQRCFTLIEKVAKDALMML